MRASILRYTFAGLLVAALSATVLAKYAMTWVNVPMERLFANLAAHIKQNPRDANAYYLLGRLHGLAFANDAKLTEPVPAQREFKGVQLPEFSAHNSALVRRDPKAPAPNEKALIHLLASAKAYQQSIKLNPNDGLTHLGLGWISEQAIPLAAKLKAIPSTPKNTMLRSDWVKQSLAEYRRAYSLSVESDLKPESHDMFAPRVSAEAGEGIVRVMIAPYTNSEKNELADIARTLKQIKDKPGYITPIVVPLGKNTEIQFLTAPHLKVNFDLAVDGRKHRYTWVRPDVAFLVWDPGHVGKVHDGQQLFGNRTWQMFWQNGYQPLAALDNNRDGVLTGAELIGLSLWTDRNSNGRSDPGEVRSLISMGIQAIGVKPEGKIGRTHWQRNGILMRDGRWLPTYDWIAEGSTI